jgi:signal transduction histidine kinase
MNLMKKILGKVNTKNSIVIALFCVMSVILWNTYNFSKKLKTNERVKMEILAKAYDRFGIDDLNQDFSLEVKIIESNHDVPMIVTDESGKILMSRNLDSIKSLEPGYLESKLLEMKTQNIPIVLNYIKDKKNIIYYKDSNLLVNLRYYPITLILTLLMFAIVIYLVFRSNKIADQNKLWSGMAKETAHQIGTPLSSLLGWVELMKMQNVNPDIVSEIEKDVDRLNIIAERFSQIGSVPDLTPLDLGVTIKNIVAYFKARSSKNVQFVFQEPNKLMMINANEQLLSWVLENLIKNAVDAMSGRGKLTIQIKENNALFRVLVTDTGKGIGWKQQKKVFNPGFTTKKRGWGLGLSLSKRIVEDYHLGKIFVKKSEVNKGTTFEIQLNKD